jgi:hypothetical protein
MLQHRREQLERIALGARRAAGRFAEAIELGPGPAGAVRGTISRPSNLRSIVASSKRTTSACAVGRP